jgi:hypothetical protein
MMAVVCEMLLGFMTMQNIGLDFVWNYTMIALPHINCNWSFTVDILIAPVLVGAVCGRLLAGISGSSPTGGMDICDLCVFS